MTRGPSFALSSTTVETPPRTGELDQLILLAILRLGSDAYGLSIALELEAHAGAACHAARRAPPLDRLAPRAAIRATVVLGPERPVPGQGQRMRPVRLRSWLT
jgi:hypothetical protein